MSSPSNQNETRTGFISNEGRQKVRRRTPRRGSRPADLPSLLTINPPPTYYQHAQNSPAE